MTVYSHSQLETFEKCPYKYRLQYIERVKTGRRSIEAFMGSTVHAALEKLYRDLRMSRLPGEDELIRYYLERWDAGYDKGIFVVSGEYGAEDYRETGLRCLRDYYRRYHPFRAGVAVWLERKVNIPIRDREGATISFTGVLDRLDSLEGGRYEIHDYKTSGTLPIAREIEEDRQLSLYQLAVEEAFPDAVEVELVWHYLVFDRELRLRRERADLERIAAEAAELVRRIEAEEEFPPRESVLCDWCEFQEHCPKRKHIFMVAEMPARELGTDHGVQLVDEFAFWAERKREAEGKLAALRGEILEFATFHGADNLRGSSGVLKITRSRQPKLPPAGSAARDEIEGLLREWGAWEEASAINPRRLGSLLGSGKLGPDRASRLEAMLSWEEAATLRFVQDRREE
ncbi:MAG: PD-(D/E)XK nuclease family protein [Actinobacteria bacterium]|nr:PD-(D/E)XK nuclease family protein [Actinomycetota bacterium]